MLLHAPCGLPTVARHRVTSSADGYRFSEDTLASAGALRRHPSEDTLVERSAMPTATQEAVAVMERHRSYGIGGAVCTLTDA